MGALPATRALSTSRVALGAKEPTTTDEMVYEWKYKGGGGVNHPLWWKAWCWTAVAIFVYENTYDFATRPCQVDVKIFGRTSSSKAEGLIVRQNRSLPVAGRCGRSTFVGFAHAHAVSCFLSSPRSASSGGSRNYREPKAGCRLQYRLLHF